MCPALFEVSRLLESATSTSFLRRRDESGRSLGGAFRLFSIRFCPERESAGIDGVPSLELPAGSLIWKPSPEDAAEGAPAPRACWLRKESMRLPPPAAAAAMALPAPPAPPAPPLDRSARNESSRDLGDIGTSPAASALRWAMRAAWMSAADCDMRTLC